MPQLPNETQWNSLPECIKSFVTNYHWYREIALEHALDVHPNQIWKYGSESYHHHFKKIFQKAIQSPQILANLMDSKFRRQHLGEEKEHSTEMWLAEHHPKFLPGIMVFKISVPDYYPASIMHANYFFCLHLAPASFASIERYFSTFGLVWSKLRNCLGIDKQQN
ncbi:hypothetical protein PR048_005509 [Dryococelus australis]|uniref:HAT C-terminal dimerisation domain-containing protein n=1 Tax=Dryococelus australis TaxID=614101 RepID=A0ABQ9IAJ6_9NEOP|nr:hypothetical protein PR048_005509 [Dryococelus australis]